MTDTNLKWADLTPHTQVVLGKEWKIITNDDGSCVLIYGVSSIGIYKNIYEAKQDANKRQTLFNRIANTRIMRKVGGVF